MIMRLIRGLMWAATKAEEHGRLVQLHNKQTKYITQVLDLKQDRIASRDYGPWKLLVPYHLDAILDDDYILAGGGPSVRTLRHRIASIEGLAEMSSSPGVTELKLESVG